MSNTSLLGSFGGQAGDALIFRNLLINGNCTIDQRNAGANQTITAAAAYAYTVDRWYAYSSGGNPVGARVAASGAYQFTGAAGVTEIGFAQRIEAANCRHLAGGTATLSVDLSNSLLTTVTWTAFYANTNDAFGTRAALTRTQIATGTFTVSSTLSRYSVSFAVPSAATTGIEIVFSVGAQTSGTWRIDNAMLEAGPTATPFERRPIGVELQMCQRYHVTLNTAAVAYSRVGSAIGTSSTASSVSIPLPTTMRVSPTATRSGNWGLFNGATLISSTSASVDLVGTNTNILTMDWAAASGLTLGSFYVAVTNNDSTARLNISAEL